MWLISLYPSPAEDQKLDVSKSVVTALFQLKYHSGSVAVFGTDRNPNTARDPNGGMYEVVGCSLPVAPQKSLLVTSCG